MTVKLVKKTNGGRAKKSPFDKRSIALLNALYHSNNEQRKALLRAADKPLVKCICECVVNTLHGSVCLSNGTKNRLKKYKNVLRRIAASCVKKQNGCTGVRSGARGKQRGFNWKVKKRLIMQRGGGVFLPLLLAPIISTLVSSLFGGKGEGST